MKLRMSLNFMQSTVPFGPAQVPAARRKVAAAVPGAGSDYEGR